MTTSLTDKVFIVTGGASGMGLATVKLLLQRGASVAVCDISSSGLEKAGKELGAEEKERTFSKVVDVTDRSAVGTFLAEAKQRFDKINGVSNIAGTGGHKLGLKPVWETTSEEFSFIVDLNFKGCFNVLGESLQPGYLEEPASIVHITSMFSMRGYKKGAIFSASKHAAIGLVRSAAMEAAERGIRVNAVMPGAIDTPMYRTVMTSGADDPVPNSPITHPGRPEEIASTIAFLLSDESTFVTGAAWSVDGVEMLYLPHPQCR